MLPEFSKELSVYLSYKAKSKLRIFSDIGESLKLFANNIKLLFPTFSFGSTTFINSEISLSGPSTLILPKYLNPFAKVEFKEHILKYSL